MEGLGGVCGRTRECLGEVLRVEGTRETRDTRGSRGKHNNAYHSALLEYMVHLDIGQDIKVWFDWLNMQGL